MVHQKISQIATACRKTFDSLITINDYRLHQASRFRTLHYILKKNKETNPQIPKQPHNTLEF